MKDKHPVTAAVRVLREHKVDFLEVHCLPDLNDGILGTSDKYSTLPETPK